jgi:hypothetical protein
MLFPLPIEIPAYVAAGLLLALDLWSFNVAAFGGTSAAYLMLHYL